MPISPVGPVTATVSCLAGRTRPTLLLAGHAVRKRPRGRQEPATRATSASDVTPARTFARPSSRSVRMPPAIAAAAIASPERARA